MTNPENDKVVHFKGFVVFAVTRHLDALLAHRTLGPSYGTKADPSRNRQPPFVHRFCATGLRAPKLILIPVDGPIFDAPENHP